MTRLHDSMQSSKWLGLVLVFFAVSLLYFQYTGRNDAREASVKACNRGLGERRDNIREEKDLQSFAKDSVVFRKSQGKFKLAAKSQAIADRTRVRIGHRTSRLVNCDNAFPAPSFLPF